MWGYVFLPSCKENPYGKDSESDLPLGFVVFTALDATTWKVKLRDSQRNTFGSEFYVAQNGNTLVSLI